MAVLGFPFEEAYREMDRLLDAAGGTGKSYGRNFQSGVRLLPGDDAPPHEDASAQTLGILLRRQIVPWRDRSAPCGLLSPASVAQDADAALEAELFSRIR